jgi:hypothetical protein
MKRAFAVAIAVVAATACSSSKTRSSPAPGSVSSSSIAAAGTATITTFVVPRSVECGAATSTVVPITYAVTGSVRREVDIDGLTGAPLPRERATVRPPVHCDALEHTAVIVAIDARGARTTRTATFATVGPG